MYYIINPLWPTDAIWRRGSCSTLVQVIAYAWRHQVFTWPNVDLPAKRSSNIHSRVTPTWILNISPPYCGGKFSTGFNCWVLRKDRKFEYILLCILNYIQHYQCQTELYIFPFAVNFQVASMSLVLYCWTWSPAPWTRSDQGLSARSSVLTISCLARVERGTTGQRATTPRALSLSILSLMLSVRRLRAATVCKVSSSHTHLGVAPAPVWAPCSSARSGKNIQTGSWTHSLWCLLLRYFPI